MRDPTLTPLEQALYLLNGALLHLEYSHHLAYILPPDRSPEQDLAALVDAIHMFCAEHDESLQASNRRTESAMRTHCRPASGSGPKGPGGF